MGLLVCTLVLSCAGFAVAGVPDLTLSIGGVPEGLEETVSIFVTPTGQGNTFDEAYLFGGNQTDATISLNLVDGLGVPIPNYPREDLWIETNMGGLAACVGGANADAATDENGDTRWRLSLFAGGFTDPATPELTQIIVNGEALESSSGYDVQFNSADINGSGAANLSDITAFTQILFGDYNYAADFLWDGVINLPDGSLMAQGNGSSCP
jgi:hypothetical protein